MPGAGEQYTLSLGVQTGVAERQINSTTAATARLGSAADRVTSKSGAASAAATRSKSAHTGAAAATRSHTAASRGLAASQGTLAASFRQTLAILGLTTIGLFGMVRAVGEVRESVGVFAEYDRAMAQVQAVTSSTREEQAALTRQTRELGEQTEFTAGQAAAAQVSLGRASFDTLEILATTPAVLDLATAATLDMGTAASLTATTLRSFGLDAEESTRVTDVFAVAAASANTDVRQLAEGIKFVGPVAAGLNIPLETTAAAIGVLSDAGLQASLAGTGLRRVLAELANPSKTTRTELAALGLSSQEVSDTLLDPSKGLVPTIELLAEAGLSATASLEIAGQRGGPALINLIKQADRIGELEQKLRDSGGAALEMADIMRNTLRGASDELKSAIESNRIEFGEGMEPALIASTKALTEFFRSSKEGAANLGVTLGAAVTGLTQSFLFLAEHVREVVSVLAGLAVRLAILKLAGPTAAALASAKAFVALAASQSLAAVSTTTLAATTSAAAIASNTLTAAIVTNQASLIPAVASRGLLAAATAKLTVATNILSLATAKLSAVIAANPLGAFAVALAGVVALLGIGFAQMKRLREETEAYHQALRDGSAVLDEDLEKRKLTARTLEDQLEVQIEQQKLLRREASKFEEELDKLQSVERDTIGATANLLHQTVAAEGAFKAASEGVKLFDESIQNLRETIAEREFQAAIDAHVKAHAEAVEAARLAQAQLERATQDQIDKFEELRDSTSAETEELRALADAYRLGDDAVRAQLLTMEIEAKLRGEAADLTAAQREELRLLFEEQQRVTATAAAEETIAELERQLDAQRRLTAAQKLGTAEAKKVERQLELEADLRELTNGATEVQAFLIGKLRTELALLTGEGEDAIEFWEKWNELVEEGEKRVADYFRAVEADIAAQETYNTILEQSTFLQRLFGQAQEKATIEAIVMARAIELGLNPAAENYLELLHKIREQVEAQFAADKRGRGLETWIEDWLELGRTVSDVLGSIDEDLGRIAGSIVDAVGAMKQLGEATNAAQAAQAGVALGGAFAGIVSKDPSRDFSAEGGALLGGVGAGVGFALGGPLGSKVGALVGSAVGSIVGSFISKGVPEATAKISQAGEELFVSIRGDKGLGGTLSKIAEGIEATIEEIETKIGSQFRIGAGGFGLKIRDDVVTVFVNGLRRQFQDVQDAISFAVTELVRTAEFDPNIGENVRKALRSGGFEDLEELNRVIELAQAIDNLGKKGSAASESIRQINALRVEETELAKKHGLALSDVIKLENARLLALRKQIDAQFAAIIGMSNFAESAIAFSRDVEAFNANRAERKAAAEGSIETLTKEIERLEFLQGTQIDFGDGLRSLGDEFKLSGRRTFDYTRQLEELRAKLAAAGESLAGLPDAIDVQKIADAFSAAGGQAQLEIIALIRKVRGEEFGAAEERRIQNQLYILQLVQSQQALLAMIEASGGLFSVSQSFLDSVQQTIDDLVSGATSLSDGTAAEDFLAPFRKIIDEFGRLPAEIEFEQFLKSYQDAIDEAVQRASAESDFGSLFDLGQFKDESAVINEAFAKQFVDSFRDQIEELSAAGDVEGIEALRQQLLSLPQPILDVLEELGLLALVFDDLAEGSDTARRAEEARLRSLQLDGINFVRSLENLGAALDPALVEELARAEFELNRQEAIATALRLAETGALQGLSISLAQLLDIIGGLEFPGIAVPKPSRPKGPKLSDEVDRFKERMARALESLSEFLDRLAGRDDPFKTSQQEFRRAEKDFNRILARAETGDIDAIEELARVADRYASATDDFLGSSGRGGEIIAGIRDAIKGILGRGGEPEEQAAAFRQAAQALTRLAAAADAQAPNAEQNQAAHRRASQHYDANEAHLAAILKQLQDEARDTALFRTQQAEKGRRRDAAAATQRTDIDEKLSEIDDHLATLVANDKPKKKDKAGANA